MKLFFYLFPLALLSLGLLSSCQQQHDDILLYEEVELCTHEATVMQGECGIYLTTKSGVSFYPNSEVDFSLVVGASVMVGYHRFSSAPTSTQTCNDGSCGGCGDQAMAQNNTPSTDPKEVCMRNADIMPAAILCIQASGTEKD